MTLLGNYWKSLREAVLAPQVDSRKLEEQIRRAQSTIPTPVIWLVGKTQSGKTSIIRALTGSDRAEIGNGFRPCTRSASTYAYPDEENCLIRFLDTRGLGETGYDPREDIAYCQSQSHLVMAVVKAMDHSQKPVLDTLRTIRDEKPNWPIILVQTAIHEGYTKATDQHVVPYPFDKEPWPLDLPHELVRSLRHQRESFAGLADRFVVVDLTLPDDGYQPVNYGLEALWDSIEAEFPHGLRAILESQPELREELGGIYFQSVWPHILSYSVAAGAAGAVPLPLVDIPVVLAIQAKMFHSIASIYGQTLNKQLMAEFASALGGGLIARIGRSFLAKFVPGFGSLVGAAYSAATTYALGFSLSWYFAQMRRGATPTSAELRNFYAKELDEGRRRFNEYLKRSEPPTSPS
jgi:uncharacterized protein (DUF697 family)